MMQIWLWTMIVILYLSTTSIIKNYYMEGCKYYKFFGALFYLWWIVNFQKNVFVILLITWLVIVFSSILTINVLGSRYLIGLGAIFFVVLLLGSRKYSTFLIRNFSCHYNK